MGEIILILGGIIWLVKEPKSALWGLGIIIAVIIIGALIILGGVFVVCYTQLRPREILTVEGPGANGATQKNTLYYTDAIYDIYQMESMYNAYGMDWDQENGTTTLSGSVKDQIMDELTGSGVRHLNLRMTGWSNGGVRQEVLTGVHTLGQLGGDGGMKKLME